MQRAGGLVAELGMEPLEGLCSSPVRTVPTPPVTSQSPCARCWGNGTRGFASSRWTPCFRLVPYRVLLSPLNTQGGAKRLMHEGGEIGQ